MGRSPCCDQDEQGGGVKKGPWTPEEDKLLVDYIQKHGHGSWRRLPKLAGLNRCGKSCRLRWTNYLRPDIKRGGFTEEEVKLIVHLHSVLGNKWSSIATKLPGRTDNEIKNYWNTHLRKKLLSMGIDPVTHRPRTDLLNLVPNLLPTFLGDMSALKLQADAAKFQLLHSLVRALATAAPPPQHPPLDLMDLQLLLNLPPPLTTVSTSQLVGQAMSPTSSSSFAQQQLGLLNAFSTTDQLGCNVTMAPPLVLDQLECRHNNAGGGATTPCEETPASSPFEGLATDSLNQLQPAADDINSDTWKDLLEQMSWFNPNDM